MSLLSRRNAITIPLVVVLVIASTGRCGLAQDETKETHAEAPPKHAVLQQVQGGVFYVHKELKEQYDQLVARVRTLRGQIEAGIPSSDSALADLKSIQNELKELQEEIESKKVFVSPFKAFTKSVTETYELGEEKLVIVTSDDIHVQGWDGPGIKCVLNKTIFAENPPPNEEFDAIKIDHELAVATELVGKTDEQRDKAEVEFMASERGRSLTEPQLESRRKRLAKFRPSWQKYREFQGREANSISVTGLKYSEGNRSNVYRIRSLGGTTTAGSKWQRTATMIVYVPKCQRLLLRGCKAGVNLRNVSTSAMLTTSGSRDQNSQGSFTISGVRGDVLIDQAPIRNITGVSGNVEFTSTDELSSTGGNHRGGFRTSSHSAPESTHIGDIHGNVTAWFLRTKLTLENIGGTIDVRNEYGDSELVLAQPLSDEAHRLVSHSGMVVLSGPSEALLKMSIHAYTQCGTVRTSLPQDEFESHNVSYGGPPRRGWMGYSSIDRSNGNEPVGGIRGIYVAERMALVWANEKRAAGLDLISNAGMVKVIDGDNGEE